jgi:hypothetical protein
MQRSNPVNSEINIIIFVSYSKGERIDQERIDPLEKEFFSLDRREGGVCIEQFSVSFTIGQNEIHGSGA